MIIEFSVSNFKSIKEEQTLSMVAEKLHRQRENTFLPEGQKDMHLLKSAVIYGANASGKSNIIKAFSFFLQLVLHSTDQKIGEAIKWYQPFRLARDFLRQPTTFRIQFIGPHRIPYHYEVEFNAREMISEQLDFFPKGYRANLFSRSGSNIKLGKQFEDKRINRRILPNHLFLTSAANNGHAQMGQVYLYFKTISVWDTAAKHQIKLYREYIERLMADRRQEHFRQRLNHLIRVSDTKIDGISVVQLSPADFQFPDAIPPPVRQQFVQQNRFRTSAVHKVYENGKAVGTALFPLSDESEGTQILFTLGGLLLKKLESGGIVFIDQLEDSLHPMLCRFLIKLFHHTKSNSRNAQIIVATHETTLLDRKLLRKDQIWITEKTKTGETELFSISDFEDLAGDIPFEKWYMSGKFGGHPNIQEIDFIFD